MPGTDPRLAEAVSAATGSVLADVGCGDGKHTVRWAERRPDSLVVGLDAEMTRLDRSLVAVRRRKLNVVFVGAAAERPPDALLGQVAEIAVVMPWGSLLDGVLGADRDVLRSLLALGAPGATLDAVVNVRPWDAPDSVDRKLAATPEPTADHLASLVKAYGELGWTLEPAGWLTDEEARALGSTWASRVVSARASRLLRLRATGPATPTLLLDAASGRVASVADDMPADAGRSASEPSPTGAGPVRTEPPSAERWSVEGDRAGARPSADNGGAGPEPESAHVERSRAES
jgi:16S rRNA (adenine(1408)-N(1))-methyltransferase